MTTHTDKTEKQMIGKLIAEISKFGGAEKDQASRLARILLPHIDAYAQAYARTIVKEAMDTVIGSDGETSGHIRPDGKLSVNLTESYRNDLRSEQRTRATDLLTQLEGEK